MKFLKKYILVIDRVNENLGRWTSWLTTFLVLVVSYDVFSRYLLNISIVGVQELEWHIFAVIFLLAAAYTYKIDEHVRVDVFYSNFSEKKKAWVNLLGVILFLIPFCVIVIYISEFFVFSSFRMGETSPDAGGLPARYILKAFIPLSFFFILLQGISQAFKSILILKNEPLTSSGNN